MSQLLNVGVPGACLERQLRSTFETNKSAREEGYVNSVCCFKGVGILAKTQPHFLSAFSRGESNNFLAMPACVCPLSLLV